MKQGKFRQKSYRCGRLLMSSIAKNSPPYFVHVHGRNRYELVHCLTAVSLSLASTMFLTNYYTVVVWYFVVFCMCHVYHYLRSFPLYCDNVAFMLLCSIINMYIIEISILLKISVHYFCAVQKQRHEAGERLFGWSRDTDVHFAIWNTAQQSHVVHRLVRIVHDRRLQAASRPGNTETVS